MADIDLSFGVSTGGASGDSAAIIKGQLEDIIKGIEPLKVKVAVDVDASKKSWATDIKDLFKGVSKSIKLKLDVPNIGDSLSGASGEMKEVASAGKSMGDSVDSAAKSIKKTETQINAAKSTIEKYYKTMYLIRTAYSDVVSEMVDGKIVFKSISDECQEMADEANRVTREFEELEAAISGWDKSSKNAVTSFAQETKSQFDAEEIERYKGSVKDATKIVTDHFKARIRLAKTKTDIEQTSKNVFSPDIGPDTVHDMYGGLGGMIQSDFVSLNHQWDTLADTLNRTTYAYGMLESIMNGLSPSDQLKIRELIIEKERELAQAIEDRVNKDRAAAESTDAKKRKKNESDAAKAEKEELTRYKKVIEDYFDAKRKLDRASADQGFDIVVGEDGRLESASGQYTELANSINRATAAYNEFKSTRHFMSDESIAELDRKDLEERNRYNEAVEAKNRDAAKKKVVKDASEEEAAIKKATDAVKKYYAEQAAVIKYGEKIWQDDDGNWETTDDDLKAIAEGLNRLKKAYDEVYDVRSRYSAAYGSNLDNIEREAALEYEKAKQAQNRQDRASADSKAKSNEAKTLKESTEAIKAYYDARKEALGYGDKVYKEGDEWTTQDENLKSFVVRLNEVEKAYAAAKEKAKAFSEENKKAFDDADASGSQGYNEAVEAKNRKDQESELKRYISQIEKLDSLLQKVKRSLGECSASGIDPDNDSYIGLKRVCDELEGMDAELRASGHSIEGFDNRLDELSVSAKQFASNIKTVGSNTKTIRGQIGELMSTLGISFTFAEVFQKAIDIGQKMFETVTEVDTAMTELKKVSDETEATYTKFLDNAKDRAHGLGATVAETVNATADFARLGHGITDASSLADAAIVYKNVADGIDDISVASESIVSTMQAFKVEAEDAMSLVDKFNEVNIPAS